MCACSSGTLISLLDSKAKPKPAKPAGRAAVKRGVIASSSEDDDVDEDRNNTSSLPAPTGSDEDKNNTMLFLARASTSKYVHENCFYTQSAVSHPNMQSQGKLENLAASCCTAPTAFVTDNRGSCSSMPLTLVWLGLLVCRPHNTASTLTANNVGAANSTP